MLTTHVESFRRALSELMPLLPLHYEKLALNKDRVPLDPNFEFYFQKEDLGELSFITLRSNGALMGYWIAFIAPGLHYQTCLTSIMDIWFIHPELAGGSAPLRLIRAVEAEMKRRGVQRWFAGEKLHTPCGRLFEAVGMQPVERTFSKWLGG